MKTLYDFRTEKLRLTIQYNLWNILEVLNNYMHHIDRYIEDRSEYRKMIKIVTENLRLIDIYMKAYKKLAGTTYVNGDFDEVREFFACLIKK